MTKRRINEGDIVTLRWKALKNWNDGRVTLTHPLAPANMTVREELIPDEDVDPQGRATKREGRELNANVLDTIKERRRDATRNRNEERKG